LRVRAMIKLQRAAEGRAAVYRVGSFLFYVFLLTLVCLHWLSIARVWPAPLSSMNDQLVSLRENEIHNDFFRPLVLVENNKSKQAWNESILRVYLWITLNDPPEKAFSRKTKLD
jgi:hypothetical protein